MTNNKGNLGYQSKFRNNIRYEINYDKLSLVQYTLTKGSVFHVRIRLKGKLNLNEGT